MPARAINSLLANLEEWVEGHEIVIDAAAPYPANLFDRAQYYAEARMCELLDAVLRRNCVFGYVSAFTTLKRPSEKIEDWGASLAMRMHPYFALKQRTEDLVMDAANAGLRAVIVNPTMCLGPWDIHDRELCLIPRLLCGEVPGAVRQILNVLDVREVAQGLVGATRSGALRPTDVAERPQYLGAESIQLDLRAGGSGDAATYRANLGHCLRQPRAGGNDGSCKQQHANQIAGADSDVSARVDAALRSVSRAGYQSSSSSRDPPGFDQVVPPGEVLLKMACLVQIVRERRQLLRAVRYTR